MKKTLVLAFAFVAMVSLNSKAQEYTTALGIDIDLGNGGTLVGPSVKHFFNENSAVQAQIVFGNGSNVLGFFYQYHGDIEGAGGLKWYAGVGPQIDFYKGGTDFYIRPMGGLDFKVPGAPLQMNFDWRPLLKLTHGTEFEAGRFGLGFRFVFSK